MTTTRTDVVSTVAEIPSAEWDALARHYSAYHCHAWMRAVENDGAATSRYVLARDSGGQLRGVLPVHQVTTEINGFYRALEVFAGLAGPWDEPTLLLGTRRGYHNELLVDPALTAGERRSVTAELLDAVPELAGELGMPRTLAWYATTEMVSTFDDVMGETLPILTNVESVLTLPGTGFDDYLRSFGSHRSSTVKEIAAFERAGYQVGMERLADTWHEAGPLMNNVERKHGNHFTDEAMTAVVRRQAETLDGISRVLACRLGGRLVAFSLFNQWGDTLYMRMVGFDYPRLTGAYEYFNVLFYEPIRFAYEHGFRWLHLGIEGHRAKVMRRAEIRPLWTVVLPANAGPTAGSVHAWNRARMRELRAEFATHRHAMVDPGWTRADGPEGTTPP